MFKVKQSAARTPTPAEAVRGLPCGLCGLSPGVACTPRGDHLSRWLSACKAGAISREQLTAVIVDLVVVTKWCVVSPEAAA